jgi:hypothetical protein
VLKEWGWIKLVFWRRKSGMEVAAISLATNLQGVHHFSLTSYSGWPQVYAIRLNNRDFTRHSFQPTQQCVLQEHHVHP